MSPLIHTHLRWEREREREREREGGKSWVVPSTLISIQEDQRRISQMASRPTVQQQARGILFFWIIVYILSVMIDAIFLNHFVYTTRLCLMSWCTFLSLFVSCFLTKLWIFLVWSFEALVQIFFSIGCKHGKPCSGHSNLFQSLTGLNFPSFGYSTIFTEQKGLSC